MQLHSTPARRPPQAVRHHAHPDPCRRVLASLCCGADHATHAEIVENIDVGCCAVSVRSAAPGGSCGLYWLGTLLHQAYTLRPVGEDSFFFVDPVRRKVWHVVGWTMYRCCPETREAMLEAVDDLLAEVERVREDEVEAAGEAAGEAAFRAEFEVWLDGTAGTVE